MTNAKECDVTDLLGLVTGLIQDYPNGLFVVLLTGEIKTNQNPPQFFSSSQIKYKRQRNKHLAADCFNLLYY